MRGIESARKKDLHPEQASAGSASKGATPLGGLAALAGLGLSGVLVLAARGGFAAAARNREQHARLPAILLLGALGLGGTRGLLRGTRLGGEALLQGRHQVDDVARLLRGRPLLA